MDCPVCRDKTMIILELDGVEVDYCVSCQGVWLDRGELELLLEGTAGKDDLLDSLTQMETPTERVKPCPICNQEMEQIVVENDNLILDQCSVEHGLWFDGGELEAVINLGTVDDQNRILKLLRDIFKHQPQ
ncbi:MAG: zf-TFIIB domain-containing protein [Bacillota bacterium]